MILSSSDSYCVTFGLNGIYIVPIHNNTGLGHYISIIIIVFFLYLYYYIM